jgi:hypothetical protein
MHYKRRARRQFAAAGAMATVATCIVTFQLVTGPAGATAVDPPSRPGVATQSGPSFPVLGTPGYVEWQGAISSAREYVSAAQQPLGPGGDVTVDYQYEYHGGWLGVLCPSTTTSCGLVKPHGPAPVPSSQLGGEWAFLGASADSQAYGTHSDQDVGVPPGPVLSRLRVPTGIVTEEVATTTVRTGPNHADVWYTVIRQGRLTFRLPTTVPEGPLFIGLNNHPSSALSIFGGAYIGATSPYRSAAYETAAWWTGGALLDLRNPTAGVPPTSLPPSIPATPPANSGTSVVRTPDLKVVRFLQVPPGDCLAQVGTLSGDPSTAAAACGFLVGSSNPTPPPDLSGKAWQSFVASKEFRGFIHLPSMSVTCTDGQISSIDLNGPVGVSPGWTPYTPQVRFARVLKEKAEWYDGMSGILHPSDVDVRYSAGRSAAVVSLREASRITTKARVLQYPLLGYDAPFIWAALHVTVSCHGEPVASVSYSTIPRVAVYADGVLQSTTDQSRDLISFIRSGGTSFHAPRTGNLDPYCQQASVLPLSGIPGLPPLVGTPASCTRAIESGTMS